MRPNRARRFVFAASVLWLACVPVPVLVPGPSAWRTPGADDVAYAELSGVSIWASGNAWDGYPSTLPDVVTPIRISLENHSGRAVRLAYRDFALIGGSGFRYAALPPFAVQGGVGELADPGSPALAAGPGGSAPAAELTALPVAASSPPAGEVMLADYHPAASVGHRAPPPGPAHPRFHSQHFWVARPYMRFYVGFPLWPLAWAMDPLYYHHWYGAWPAALPNEDMLRRALPEGVLDEGGTVTGHLYFQHAGREASAELEVQLEDAKTGEALGTARLPFLVRR